MTKKVAQSIDIGSQRIIDIANAVTETTPDKRIPIFQYFIAYKVYYGQNDVKRD